MSDERQHAKEKELPSPRRSSNDSMGRSWPGTRLGHKFTPLILQLLAFSLLPSVTVDTHLLWSVSEYIAVEILGSVIEAVT